MSGVLSAYSREMTAIAFQRGKNKFEQYHPASHSKAMARQERRVTEKVGNFEDDKLASVWEEEPQHDHSAGRIGKSHGVTHLSTDDDDILGMDSEKATKIDAARLQFLRGTPNSTPSIECTIDHDRAPTSSMRYRTSPRKDGAKPSYSTLKTNPSLKGILSSSRTNSRDVNAPDVPYRHTSSVRFFDDGISASPVASEHFYEMDRPLHYHCSRAMQGREELCGTAQPKFQPDEEDDVGIPIAHKDSLDLISKRGISIKPNSSIRYRDKNESDNRERDLGPKDSLSLLVDRRRLSSSLDVEEGDSSRKNKPCGGSSSPERTSAGIYRRKQDTNRAFDHSMKMMSQSDDLRSRKKMSPDRICENPMQPHWEAASSSRRTTKHHYSHGNASPTRQHAHTARR